MDDIYIYISAKRRLVLFETRDARAEITDKGLNVKQAVTCCVAVHEHVISCHVPVIFPSTFISVWISTWPFIEEQRQDSKAL